MENVKLEDILIIEEKSTPADICGKLLGQVSNGQLLAVINAMEGGSSSVVSSGRNTLPRAVFFQEDEE